MKFSLYVGSKKYSLSAEDDILKMYPEEFNCNYKVLIGNKDILKDLQIAYKNLFQESVDKYNKNSKKIIKDYYCKVNESKKLSLATGILIKISTLNYNLLKNKAEIITLFQNQLKELKKILPNFYVVSAILYFDEEYKTFKLRVIGIPYIKDSENKLEVRLAKSSIFKRDTIEEIRLKLQIQAKNVFKEKEVKIKKFKRQRIEIEQLTLFQIN
ncbi:MAG: hypothetical protein SOY60_05090 [Fusobacterium gastrosuis]|uniref:hypothetical protein n=1 Tax=Fusobacterium gastrosuis TaxID=1755100 RepID=UPI002970DA18|nr:hypothetical protein [Fusobacteriaceae bacterium]MDY4011021.1 hypothetical protein [Fusobacterium gastrosuis]MDY5713527.1 hypothetical protein [Fusobacterium gastrosuis]